VQSLHELRYFKCFIRFADVQRFAYGPYGKITKSYYDGSSALGGSTGNCLRTTAQACGFFSHEVDIHIQSQAHAGDRLQPDGHLLLQLHENSKATVEEFVFFNDRVRLSYSL
jgi:hypothetical protein